MTRATYNADNTITELPWMEPPNKLLYSEREILQYHDDVVQYGRHLATLRTLPCSPECRDLWKVGQEYEEGKDYEIKGAGDWKWCYQLKGNIFAAPLGMTTNDWKKVDYDESGEDSLWLDVIKRIAFEYISIRKDNPKVQIHTDAAIAEFKQKYIITKR